VTNIIPRIEFGLQAMFRRQDVCPFCLTRNHSVVARKHAVVRIRRCRGCFLYFTDPIYRSFIGDLYESLYNAEGSTTAVPGRPMLDALKATEFADSDKNCRAQLDMLKRLGAGRDLLEIGSSWGYFLYQAKAAGFRPIGVEPGRTRREYGVRELGVDIRDSINAVGRAAFDVVFSAHTLEHIVEVSGFFSGCYDRLRAGGLLVIEVPHFDVMELGPSNLAIIGSVHPLGLSRSFFTHVLPKEGFRLVGIYDHWSHVPSRPVSDYTEGILIVVAEKTERPAAEAT
jgi:SAM-dependent methyltransferase